MLYKYLAVVVWVVGLLLIIISTLNFGFEMPKLTENLEQKQKQYDTQSNYCFTYQTHLNNALLYEQQLKILDETNPSFKHLPDMRTQLKQSYFGILIYFHKCAGLHLDSFEIEKLGSLGLEEIKKEYKNNFNEVFKNELIQELNSPLQNEINNLKKDREFLLRWSIIFQIFGLLFNQIGVIITLWIK